MATNLWTDVDALVRLAATARAAESSTPDERRFGAWSASDETPVEVAAIERPARVVSGDFHDTFLLDDRTLALAIADISGKGVPAGVLRAFASSMVRHVSAFSTSPADTLLRVNRMLYDARLEAMYVTIVLGWLDLPTGRLRYANAGHPRPIRIAPGGTTGAFGSVTGPILGILDGVTYGLGEETLAPGDTLLLYTDGVSEARGPGGRVMGPRGLAELAARHAGGSAAEMCAAIARSLEAHQGRRRHDDATFLAVRYKGMPLS